MMLRILISVALALALSWIALVLFILPARPRGSLLQEALRLLPDTLWCCDRSCAVQGRKHWPGTPDGLAALWRAARLPGSPSDGAPPPAPR